MSLDTLQDYELEQLAEGLKLFAEPVLAPYRTQVVEEVARRRERRTLGGMGRMWTPPQTDGESIVGYPELDQQVAQLHELLQAATPVSVRISGDHGTGKSVLVDRLFARLQAEGWLLFEASAAEVLAGQKYIGELEERVREMLVALVRTARTRAAFSTCCCPRWNAANCGWSANCRQRSWRNC